MYIKGLGVLAYNIGDIAAMIAEQQVMDERTRKAIPKILADRELLKAGKPVEKWPDRNAEGQNDPLFSDIDNRQAELEAEFELVGRIDEPMRTFLQIKLDPNVALMRPEDEEYFRNLYREHSARLPILMETGAVIGGLVEKQKWLFHIEQGWPLHELSPEIDIFLMRIGGYARQFCYKAVINIPPDHDRYLKLFIGLKDVRDLMNSYQDRELIVLDQKDWLQAMHRKLSYCWQSVLVSQ